MSFPVLYASMQSHTVPSDAVGFIGGTHRVIFSLFQQFLVRRKLTLLTHFLAGYLYTLILWQPFQSYGPIIGQGDQNSIILGKTLAPPKIFIIPKTHNLCQSRLSSESGLYLWNVKKTSFILAVFVLYSFFGNLQNEITPRCHQKYVMTLSKMLI